MSHKPISVTVSDFGTHSTLISADVAFFCEGCRELLILKTLAQKISPDAFKRNLTEPTCACPQPSKRRKGGDGR